MNHLSRIALDRRYRRYSGGKACYRVRNIEIGDQTSIIANLRDL
jgi:hypothetical protein